MPTDTDEWRMVAFLVALCAVGIVTAGLVGQSVAYAFTIPR